MVSKFKNSPRQRVDGSYQGVSLLLRSIISRLTREFEVVLCLLGEQIKLEPITHSRICSNFCEIFEWFGTHNSCEKV
jgi:hypothetical protein